MLLASSIHFLSGWRCSCCNAALSETQKRVGEECQRSVEACGEAKETQKQEKVKQQSSCRGENYSSFYGRIYLPNFVLQFFPYLHSSQSHKMYLQKFHNSRGLISRFSIHSEQILPKIRLNQTVKKDMCHLTASPLAPFCTWQMIKRSGDPRKLKLEAALICLFGRTAVIC